MTDARLRIPVDTEYVNAIGLATIAFARLEWNAVWCCERLSPDYIRTIEPKRKTAGKIALDFIALVDGVGDFALKQALSKAAHEFHELVAERNGLLHGKPGTASNGDQRLFRHGTEWTISRVNQLADAFTECSIVLNAFLYGALKAD